MRLLLARGEVLTPSNPVMVRGTGRPIPAALVPALARPQARCAKVSDFKAVPEQDIQLRTRRNTPVGMTTGGEPRCILACVPPLHDSSCILLGGVDGPSGIRRHACINSPVRENRPDLRGVARNYGIHQMSLVDRKIHKICGVDSGCRDADQADDCRTRICISFCMRDAADGTTRVGVKARHDPLASAAGGP